MSDVILLDTGIIGLVTNPKATPEGEACSAWLQGKLRAGVRVLVPEICDYEHRRGLLRVGKAKDLTKLDALKAALGSDPITSEIMLQAAEFWAEARRRGFSTADDKALDSDMILCAHAEMLGRRGHKVVIATTNVKHLSLFTDARAWKDI
jgi:predicted nucleic acid-binding protein